MTNVHGDYIWYELMTTDPDGARTFYEGLVGWNIEDQPSGDQDYRMICAASGPVAGLMPLTQEMCDNGAQPLWAGYIGVDDVDASAAKITEHGGTIMLEPQDIPGVGRFAFASDPSGVPFYVMRGSVDEESDSFAKYEPQAGHCAWNELTTADQAAANKFYTALFGWEKADTMDMGEMGAYDMYANGDYTLGAIMQKPAEMPMSMWSYYFRVPDIDAAAAYVGANGGQIINGPMEIPGGEYVFTAIDPQGAMFSLIGAKGA